MSGSHGGLVKYIVGGLWRANEECKGESRATEEGVDTTEGRIVCSYMEIYNEAVKDLLAPAEQQNGVMAQPPLKVREHPSEGAYVANLSYFPVDTYQDVERLLSIGSKARTTKSTKANKRSSRSHAVLTVVFEQNTMRHDHGGCLVAKSTKTARVHLVDLAGSERVKQTGATGATLNEASHINKSLAALGDVIKALAKAGKAQTAPTSSFVPYRNSTLTYLLKESLGGNSVTVMIATVSPSLDHFEETLSTLKYAERAKKMVNHVKMNSSTTQMVPSTHAEIQKLRSEVERLRNEKEEMIRAFTDTPARGLSDWRNQGQIDDIDIQIAEALSCAEEAATPHVHANKRGGQVSERREHSHQDTPAPLQHTARNVAQNVHKMAIGSLPTLPENAPTLVNLNPDPMFTEKIKYPIPSGVATVGSDPSNDVVLASASVAPHHCVVSYEKRTGLLMLANFEGSETYVNGRMIEAVGNDVADGMRLSPNHARRSATSVTLQHGFRLCFGSSGTHVFRLEFVTNEADERRVKADYEFAREEMRLVQNEEIRAGEKADTATDQAHGFEGSRRPPQHYQHHHAQQSHSADDELPQEFEDMFNSMTPPPPSEASSATFDQNNQNFYTHPHNIQNEDIVINSIASKLDNFASQLDELSQDDEKLQNSLKKLASVPISDDRHQHTSHSSPFSVYGYNPASVKALKTTQSRHTPSKTNASHTESELEFLEYERALTDRLSPHSDSTVVLNAEGGEIAVDGNNKEELSESFAIQSRAALESLRREIQAEEEEAERGDEEEEDEFDAAINDVFNSAPEQTPAQAITTQLTATEKKREAARQRLRSR